jgi:hypothetical protein
MYLGEPPVDRHGLAVRAGGHVAASQHAGRYVRCKVELGTQDIGESAFAGLQAFSVSLGVPPSMKFRPMRDR